MANPRLQVTLNGTNLVVGVVVIVVALVLFAWLLPMILPAEAMFVISSVVIGVLAWYLIMVARN